MIFTIPSQPAGVARVEHVQLKHVSMPTLSTVRELTLALLEMERLTNPNLRNEMFALDILYIF